MLLPLALAVTLAGMGIDPVEPKTFVTAVNQPHVMAASGQRAKAELKFRISDGYHVNSNVPRSSYLIPTKLTLNPPAAIVVGKITYPPGEDFVFPFAPDEKLNVYSGEFAISADLKLAETAKIGEHKIHGELTYQACNDRACFPPKKLPVTIEVEVSKRRAPANLTKN